MTLVRPDGAPLGAPETPTEDLIEIPIPPKENAELKEASHEYIELDKTFKEVAAIIIKNQAAAFEILHRLGENEERRIKARDRAIKATGVHADRFRGVDLARGMMKVAKKKSN